MPRSSRARSSPSPSRPPMRRASPPPPSSVPAHAPPAQMAPMGAQPRQPGLMGQMAATAGGVAIGSAVGHTIGAALTGGFGGRGGEAVPADQQQQQGVQPYNQQPYTYNNQQAQGAQGPCAREMAQFVECANQYSDDLGLCAGFNEVLKACRIQNNLSPSQNP